MDYSAMLSSIRTDQDTETFVTDLRQNKEKVLLLVDEIMKERKSLPREKRGVKHAVGNYLDIVLKQHVFDIDPYAGKRFGFEWQKRQREKQASDLTRITALTWLDYRPNSEAAKAVSMRGINASPKQHQRFLQELWPAFLPVITSQAEKKDSHTP